MFNFIEFLKLVNVLSREIEWEVKNLAPKLTFFNFTEFLILVNVFSRKIEGVEKFAAKMTLFNFTEFSESCQFDTVEIISVKVVKYVL